MVTATNFHRHQVYLIIIPKMIRETSPSYPYPYQDYCVTLSFKNGINP